MHITDIISLILLITFGTGYILKLILLKKKNNINANVLAKGNKLKLRTLIKGAYRKNNLQNLSKDTSIFFIEIFVKATSSSWLLTWILEIIFHNQISSYVINFFFINTFTTFIGIMLTAIGVCIFILSTIFMKSSWRVGIDKNTKTTLVTNGIYKFSRNPAFVGFYFMFIGLFFTYTNIITLIVLVINVAAFHLLIMQEEKHLLTTFGDEYESYKRKVPRYF